jgi:GNAT superfamily N-acetyltransferase
MRQQLPAGYELDDDRDRLDLDAILDFLTTSAYWGTWRSRADISTQIERAWLTAGVYAPDARQVGFARVVGDGLALAYLADVYVLDRHRGRGLGQALVAFTVAHGPSWRWLLHTRDAGGLYERFGFAPAPGNLMERPPPNGLPGTVRVS